MSQPLDIDKLNNTELIYWHDIGSAFCSVQSSMRKSPTYERIISKGREIVPDVLKYLRDNEAGMSVMLLLWDILQISPYKPETITNDNGTAVKGMVGFKVSEARQAWIDWGLKEKLI